VPKGYFLLSLTPIRDATGVQGGSRLLEKYKSKEKWLIVKIFHNNSENGDFIKAFGGKGQGPGEFSGLLQLAFDSDDHLSVYDFASKRLSRFTHDGTYLSEVTIQTTYVPAGLAIDDSSQIYLSFYNHRQDKVIHKYSATGERLASFGLPLLSFWYRYR
jgi:hypothetical protein